MIRDDINGMIATAMKSHDAVRLSVMKSVKARFIEAEKGTLSTKPVTDWTNDVEVKILMKMREERLDSAKSYTAGGRKDLADAELKEAEILSEFLPKDASEEDIQNLVKEIIASLDHEVSKRDIGLIKGKVQEKYPTANGGVIAQIVMKNL